MTELAQFVSEHSWWVNQIGIVLEIVGAMLIVAAAFRTRGKVKDIPNLVDADLSSHLRDVIADQAFTERRGFGLLAVGLVFQLLGGFG